MTVLGINLCLAALAVAIACIKRRSRTTHVVCAASLMATQVWLSVRYATAYRSIGAAPAEDLLDGASRAWFLGACEMNRWTLHSYIPAFIVHAVALTVLVVLAARVKSSDT